MVAQVTRKYFETRPWKLWSRLVAYILTEGRPLTTKGRWINPLIFFLFAVQKKLPLLKKVQAPTYILGTGRSGTTVLGVVLSMHKEVGYLNEPKALWNSVYPGEDLIGSYSHESASYNMDASDATETLKKSASKLYGAFLFLSGSRRIVDKYPEMIFRVPFLQTVFPDSKFLFLARNGHATSASISDWSKKFGKERDSSVNDWWGVNRRKWTLLVDQVVPQHEDLSPHSETFRLWENHESMALLEWIVSMRKGLELCDKYPNQVLQVSYEELCSRPKITLSNIAKFLSLPIDNTYLDYGASILTPPKSRRHAEIPTELEKPFSDTMKLLGYLD